MRKSLVLAFVLSTLAVSAWAIGEARLTGKVLDAEGKPLEGVTIVVTSASAAKNITENFKTDKNGKFTVFMLDGTIPYKFSYQKEGFATFEETMKLKLLPERNERNITLAPPTAAAVGTPIADPGIDAYNAGAELANQGMNAEAIAKIEEAVAAKPDLTVGHMALAKLYVRTEAWAKAIESANKALAISPDEPDMFAVLAQAYEKTGDKAKAKEFKTKAPANPPALFNDAAKLINEGNDKDAEPLLRRAVEADPAFAQAQYELGMVYVRTGNVAGAKAHLEKYLELEPNGKDAPVAKEMLKYVK
ncbi:MAG TPA: tetratricopeptide repeat protein [Thermoanaerobaculia bacterium]|nr:tetratricopeptide repeat protein [Thermoanaerobaculia bacterium]